MVKSVRYSLALLFSCLFGFQMGHATHIYGGELSYFCVNPCTIRVELKYYMDCQTNNFVDTTGVVFIPPAPNCPNLPVPLTAWSSGVGTELTTVCPYFSPTTCTDPNSPHNGIEEIYYFKDYDVCAASACDFTLSWTKCCRHFYGTNLSNPNTLFNLVSTTVDNTTAGCNSSPVFDNLSALYACAGQSISLSLGATDPDGDSLSFRLGDCVNGQGQSAVYNPGYSGVQPLGPSWNAFLDPANGDLTLTAQPGVIEYAAICVYVDEFRNGLLVNTIARDYMFSVRMCPNLLCGTNLVTGTIYEDANSNCTIEATEMTPTNWQVLVQPGNFVVPTDTNGEFRFFPLPGTYTLTPTLPTNSYWTAGCPVPLTQTVTLPATGDTLAGIDFGVESTGNCPSMWVDIVSGPVRRCLQTDFHIYYCNYGTDTANNVLVEVTLGSNFNYHGSNATLVSSSGNTYTFDLDTLPHGDCGSFYVSANFVCNGQSYLGQTICTEAHIFPDSLCLPPNPLWDGSHVEVQGTCNWDTTCYLVSNTGTSMQGTTDWRLYESGFLINSGTLQLCGGCDTTLCFPTNGNPFRLEVDQRPFHPSLNTPNCTVEACGQPFAGLMLPNIFYNNNGDDYLTTYCREVINSYDPNSKQVSPAGADTVFHYIDSTDVLEYTIDFQNTGTADALLVTLIDTISPHLDLLSIVPGASSHSYTWQVLSDRRLQFTFDNINLVPISQDSLLSIGYVKFKIRQAPGNTMGTRIENTADIIFDYNPPIRTNTTFNTIGWPAVVGISPAPQQENIVVYPNPTTGEVFAEVLGMEEGKVFSFEMFSTMGQKVVSSDFKVGQLYRSDMRHFPRGVYLYRILDGGQMVKAGKLILE